MAKYNLGSRQHSLLIEALRRRSRFGNDPLGGKGLTQQWTGLGSRSEYAPVNPRYMVDATGCPKRTMTWWRLTPEGAAIVQEWINKGYTHEDIETSGRFPPGEGEAADYA